MSMEIKCAKHKWYANFPWECANCGYRRELLGITKGFVGYPQIHDTEYYCDKCDCYCGCHPCKHTPTTEELLELDRKEV